MNYFSHFRKILIVILLSYGITYLSGCTNENTPKKLNNDSSPATSTNKITDIIKVTPFNTQQPTNVLEQKKSEYSISEHPSEENNFLQKKKEDKSKVEKLLIGNWNNKKSPEVGYSEFVFSPGLKFFNSEVMTPINLDYRITGIIVISHFDENKKEIMGEEHINERFFNGKPSSAVFEAKQNVREFKIKFNESMSSFDYSYFDNLFANPTTYYRVDNKHDNNKNAKIDSKNMENKISNQDNIMDEKAYKAIAQKNQGDMSYIIILNRNAVINDKEFKIEDDSNIYGHNCYIFGYEGGNSISYVVDKITWKVYEPIDSHVGNTAKIYVLREVK